MGFEIVWSTPVLIWLWSPAFAVDYNVVNSTTFLIDGVKMFIYIDTTHPHDLLEVSIYFVSIVQAVTMQRVYGWAVKQVNCRKRDPFLHIFTPT